MLDNSMTHSLHASVSARDDASAAGSDSRAGASSSEGTAAQGRTSRGKEHSPQWFVGRHRPYQGHLAAERATAAGFRVIVPRQTIRKPYCDDVISPVFPGYLFVQFDPASDWGALLREQIGLVSILGTPLKQPLALPLGFVEEFMQGANADGIFPYWWPGEPPASVRLADKIGREHRVTSGPWASFTGKCTSANRNRVGLLLDLFGRQTIVEFRPEQLEDVK